jgi:hypothetical protein
VGRTYFERGEPVVVLAQWRTGGAMPQDAIDLARALLDDGAGMAIEGVIRRPMRNVLIRRANGELVVRPFRGLRVAGPRPSGNLPPSS